ncbi:transposase [Streptomyces sp. NPDC045251]|uniref:transposase n=1 Tax=unclassified Streptomyces TaxID=2593676 RepID=UPI003402D48B
MGVGQGDRRQVFNGIWWRARTGAPWRDIPDRYGPWETLYSVFRRWQIDGTWARILEKLQVKADTAGHIEWEVSVDSTICRAHQHAAGNRKRGPSSGRAGWSRAGGRAGRPRHRPLSRRPDHGDSSRCRLLRARLGHGRHRRSTG